MNHHRATQRPAWSDSDTGLPSWSGRVKFGAEVPSAITGATVAWPAVSASDGPDFDPEFDVLCVGNALVDVLSATESETITRQGLVKGTMALVDEERAEMLYASMGPAIEVSGGSAANTAAGVASLGGAAAFVGRVRDDQLGAVFAHDLRAVGVHYATPPARSGPATGRCLIMVTTDAQRTMSTYLGAAADLEAADVDLDLVGRAAVTYLEGYLWDRPAAKEAFRTAMVTARRAGRRTALTLSDPFCVERYKDEFRALVEAGSVDVLFANEPEITALFDVADLDAAVEAVRGRCELAALTRGAEGSLVVTAGAVDVVEAFPVDFVADTTGAGDLYAAGFLFGLTTGLAPADCARLGGLAAAEVIAHFGARPETSLARLAKEAGLPV